MTMKRRCNHVVLVLPPRECRRSAAVVWNEVSLCSVTLTFDVSIPNNVTSSISQGQSLYQLWTLWDHSFLSLVSTLTRDIDIAILSVLPSVRLSVRDTLVLTHVWKRLNISSQFFSPYGSPIILFLQHQTSSRNFDGVARCGGDKYRWGIKISRFSTNKSLYLANDTRYRHSYYGRRIGRRRLSIKWCHFQWPWTNPNPVFKVIPLFDVKYLTNGYIYGHSYYRRQIGNRTKAFEWHQFQWPWVTSKPDFKITILFNVK